jgi:hypothetical protein
MTHPQHDDIASDCEALMRLAHTIGDQNPAFLIGFLMAGAVATGIRHGYSFDQLTEEFGLSMEAFIRHDEAIMPSTTSH